MGSGVPTCSGGGAGCSPPGGTHGAAAAAAPHCPAPGGRCAELRRCRCGRGAARPAGPPAPAPPRPASPSRRPEWEGRMEGGRKKGRERKDGMGMRGVIGWWCGGDGGGVLAAPPGCPRCGWALLIVPLLERAVLSPSSLSQSSLSHSHPAPILFVPVVPIHPVPIPSYPHPSCPHYCPVIIPSFPYLPHLHPSCPHTALQQFHPCPHPACLHPAVPLLQALVLSCNNPSPFPSHFTPTLSPTPSDGPHPILLPSWLSPFCPLRIPSSLSQICPHPF